MTTVSKDNPFYFITSVTHDRLTVFQKDKLKDIMCDALDEARTSAGLLIFAYAVMLEHFHIITDSKRSQSDALRYLGKKVLGELCKTNLWADTSRR